MKLAIILGPLFEPPGDALQGDAHLLDEVYEHDRRAALCGAKPPPDSAGWWPIGPRQQRCEACVKRHQELTAAAEPSQESVALEAHRRACGLPE